MMVMMTTENLLDDMTMIRWLMAVQQSKQHHIYRIFTGKIMEPETAIFTYTQNYTAKYNNRNTWKRTENTGKYTGNNNIKANKEQGVKWNNLCKNISQTVAGNCQQTTTRSTTRSLEQIAFSKSQMTDPFRDIPSGRGDLTMNLPKSFTSKHSARSQQG